MTGFLATVDFANPYFPVLILLGIALAMAVGFVFLSQALGPKKYDRTRSVSGSSARCQTLENWDWKFLPFRQPLAPPV